MNEVITTIITNLLHLVLAVAGAAVTGLLVPWVVKTVIPWLKEKRLYGIVKKFVEAAEKSAEAGKIDKATKKEFVERLLEAKGIEITPEVDAIIEAAVEELDIAKDSALRELIEAFIGELDIDVEDGIPEEVIADIQATVSEALGEALRKTGQKESTEEDAPAKVPVPPEQAPAPAPAQEDTGAAEENAPVNDPAEQTQAESE